MAKKKAASRQREKRSRASNRLGRNLKDGLAPVAADPTDLDQAASHENQNAGGMAAQREVSGFYAEPQVEQTVQMLDPQILPSPEPKMLAEMEQLTRTYAAELRRVVERHIELLFWRTGM